MQTLSDLVQLYIVYETNFETIPAKDLTNDPSLIQYACNTKGTWRIIKYNEMLQGL